MKQITTIGLDLAKNVFQIHGADAEGAPIFNRKPRRAEAPRFFEKLPPCLVGLEACGGSHYWAREIAALGHDARLIPPVYVKPFVKRGKTDAADPEAISEAVTRKTMRFVPIKSADQQAAVMALKTRALLVRQQTQAINALRGYLSELGVIAGVGVTKVKALIEIVRDEADDCPPQAARLALAEIADQIEALTRQIDKLEREIVAEAKRDEDMRRLTAIPGVGAIRRLPSKHWFRIPTVQIRPSLRRLAGTDAKVPFERRQGATRRHIENGQSDAPLAARLWRDVSPAASERQRQGAAMANRTFGA